MRVSKDGKAIYDIDDAPDSVKAAAAKGYVPVVKMTKDGQNHFDVMGSEDSITAAIGKGYKVSDQPKSNAAPSPLDKNYDMSRMIPDPEKNRKAMQGLYSGSPIAEKLPVIGPLLKKGTNAAMAGFDALTGDQSFGDAYKAREQASADQLQQEGEENPDALRMKEAIAGMAAPTALKAGASPVMGVVERFAPEAKGLLTGGLRQAGIIGERTAQNAGQAYADARLRDIGTDEAEKGAGTTAKLTAGVQIAPWMLRGLAKGYSRGVAQIRPDVLSDYRGNRETIKSMDPVKTYGEFADAAGEMRKRGELMEEGANRSIDTDRQRAFSEAESRKQSALARASEERSEGLSRAEKIKADVESRRQQGMDEADRIQRTTAEGLSKSQQAARKAVNEAAAEALEVAAQSGAKIKIAPFKASLTQRLNQFKVGDTRVGPGVKALEQIQDRLSAIGQKEVTAAEMRTLIKSLDDDIQDIMSQTARAGYITPAEREISGVRKGWSDRLKKQVPGYAEAQSKTQGKTQALKDFQNQFDYDPDQIYRQLKDLDAPERMDRLNALRRFESEFGGDAEAQISRARELRNKDFSPELSEADALKKRDYEGQYKMDFDIAEAMKRQDFSKPYEADFSRAKDLKNLGKYVTNEDQARVQMERFGQKPEQNIRTKKQMEAIAREKGLPEDYFLKNARMAAVKRSMEGGSINGSRLVNAGRATGEGIAELAGGRGEKALGMIGAWAGLASDVLGKSVVRRVVDAVDSPNGQKFLRGLRAASNKGPRAVSIWHNMMLQRDPEYRELVEGAKD